MVSLRLFSLSRPHIGRILSALALSVLIVSCSRVEPLDRKVDAASDSSLANWRQKMGEDLTLKQWKDFDEAVQEMRNQIMADGTASGAAGIEQAMRTKINGLTVRDVLVAGFSYRLYRLEAEKHEAEDKMTYNARLKTKEGDVESAEYLKSMVETQRARLDSLNERIAAAEEKLKSLGAQPTPANAAAPAK